MLDYEFSAESLYADGTGMSSVKPVATYYAMSSEANDGDLDSTFNDVQSAENALQFLDLYSAIENKNASDKIRMLRKIKANYGGNSSQLTNSVENYCNELSMEAEAAAAAAGGDASADPKSEASGKGGKEKKNFFVVMFKAIGNFFVMIWKFFVNIWNAIVNFVKNLFTKKKKKEEAGDAEAVPPVAKAKAVAGPSIQIDFAKSNLGSGKITSFVQEYERLGRDIVAVFNNIEQEVFNGQQGDKRTLDSVNLGKNSISHLERFRDRKSTL